MHVSRHRRVWPRVIAVLWLAGILCGMLPCMEAAAELTFARVFDDHMVLPRTTRVPVWGKAVAGSPVSVSFADQVKHTTTDAAGAWSVILDPLHASTSGRVLRASTPAASNVLRDVLVGEVWLAAGQSNMRWPVSSCSNPPEAGHYDLIRMCDWEGSVGTGSRTIYGPDEFARLTPSQFYAGTWQRLDAAHVRAQSAVAYFFANALVRSLRGTGPNGGDVPVGVVELAVGGTSTEAFIPAAAHVTPQLRAAFADPRGTRSLGQWTSGRIARNLGRYTHANPALPHPHPFAPGFLYWTGVQPLVPFAFRGVIWYQGESNAEFTDPPYRWDGDRLSDHQALVMTALVDSWRAAFGRNDLPFYMVQLPRIEAPNRAKWPWYREAQARVADSREGVELAVTLEFGAASGNVHPRDKAPVGERLAYIARNQVYGQDVAYSGPLIRTHSAVGNRIVLHFDHVGQGLMSDDGEPLRHFTVAGEDGTFVAAVARIVGQTVEVSAASVPEPVAVRYAWHMNVDVNFFGSNRVENLPVRPFRTDTWRETHETPRHLKLFVLTGQSNALGTTNGGERDPSSGADPADAHVLFYWHNINSKGDSIGDSGGVFTTLQDQQGGYYAGSATHWGGEMECARTLFRAGVRDFGIIKATRGGGGNSFWSKGSNDDHMYAHITNTVARAVGDLAARGHSADLAGLLYLQGESDRGKDVVDAGIRLKALTENLRNDLPEASRLVTFVAGTTAAGHASSQKQAAIAEVTSGIEFFTNADLSLAPDGLHLDKAAKRRLGNRWAQAILNADIVSRDYGKLVFIGDSITQGGNGHPSYRYQVFRNLAAAGVAKDTAHGYTFVGSQTGAVQNNAGSTPPVNGQSFLNVHDGHWGWRAFWLNGRVPLPAGRYRTKNLGEGTLANWTGQANDFATADHGWIDYRGGTYVPDMAVVMIGINDIAGGSKPACVRDDIACVVDQLQTANASIRVFLCEVLHTDQGANRKRMVDALNAMLPALARSKTTAASPVWVIETNVGFDPSTLTYDAVHPNAEGEVYVGNLISGGLGIIERPVVTVAPPVAEAESIADLDHVRFSGADIFNSGNFVRGWSGSGELSTPVPGDDDDLNLVHPGGAESMLNGTDSGWNAINRKAWRFEARLRFNANPNGFVLWLGTDTDRILVEIHAGHTQAFASNSFHAVHNNMDGAFHTFSVQHQPDTNRYFVWRDGLLLTPRGVPYDQAGYDSRLLLGDYTRGGFGDGFDVTVDYIQLDTANFSLSPGSDTQGPGASKQVNTAAP